MSEATKSWCYIARTKTPRKYWPEVGSVVAAMVDRPEFSKDKAELIASWILDGLSIERVPTEWVRKYLGTTQPYHAPSSTEAS